MNTNLIKLIAATLLFAAWAAAICAKAHWPDIDVAEFITSIRDALVALGIFHLTLTNPKQ
jgi:hypothetical protein